MLACGAPWSSNDYIIYSLIHDRPLCSKPLLKFRCRVPQLSTVTMSRQQASYQPSLTRRLPTIYIKEFAICGHTTGGYVSPAGQLSRL
eukprot:1158377-Pleurochrysis_carterae.AAC.1